MNIKKEKNNKKIGEKKSKDMAALLLFSNNMSNFFR